MNRENLLLLIIHHAGDEPIPPIHLQHLAFLAGRNIPQAPPDYYRFKAHHHGPFSHEMLEDLSKLREQRLVFSICGDCHTWQKTAISPTGSRRARQAARELSPQSRRYLRHLAAWAGKCDSRDMMNGTFQEYPEMGVNSVMKEPARS